jgi:hypothetical protein
MSSPQSEPRSYYGHSIVKPPVWRWPIPAYFFSGGLAAGSSLLGLAARLSNDAPLARRSRITALAAMVASAGFLVGDLGKPERFVNMLRVAKPTSPMSVGTWVLTFFGPAVGVATATDVLGILPTVNGVADAGAAVLAPIVATYTAVLIADTSVPVWHEGRHQLPFLFAAGACASAGGMATVFDNGVGPRRMALVGAVGELGAANVMERSLGELAEPFRTGLAGKLSRTAKELLAAGAGFLAVSGRRRPAVAKVGGALVMLGSAVERFAVVEAGRQSAKDPKFTVGPQRGQLVPSGAGRE